MRRNRFSREGNPNGQYIEGMGFDTTVVPASIDNGAGLQALRADPYYTLSVDTRDAGITAPVPVILFDSSQGYQLNTGTTNDPLTVINGETSHYQFMLNDVAHNASYIRKIQLQVTGGASVVQFSKPLMVYSSSKGSMPKLVATIHPNMGFSEEQYQTDIITFNVNLVIDNRHAIVYEQENGIQLRWSFFQGAELGRKI